MLKDEVQKKHTANHKPKRQLQKQKVFHQTSVIRGEKFI